MFTITATSKNNHFSRNKGILFSVRIKPSDTPVQKNGSDIQYTGGRQTLTDIYRSGVIGCQRPFCRVYGCTGFLISYICSKSISVKKTLSLKNERS